MSAQEVDPKHTEEEYEEEVEYEEVEEEEGEQEEEVEEEEEAEPQTPTPVKKSGPGKVNPSKAVKNMKLESPSTRAGGLTPAKNPFTSMGKWTPQAFQEIDIQFPILGAKNESTNDLTRDSKPEARYWKAPLKFSYATYTSETIRIDNVHVPYHNGRNYGDGFIYVCLPEFMATRMAEVGKARRPTVTGENSLQADPNRWWKIANNVTDKIGTISPVDKKFHAKSLSATFEGSGKGVTLSIVARFIIKASTEEKSSLKPTTTQRIVLEIERGYVGALDVDVQPPTRIMRNKQKSEPVATAADIASDALMKRLAELGL